MVVFTLRTPSGCIDLDSAISDFTLTNTDLGLLEAGTENVATAPESDISPTDDPTHQLPKQTHRLIYRYIPVHRPVAS
jgi:hypothetical protein